LRDELARRAFIVRGLQAGRQCRSGPVGWPSFWLGTADEADEGNLIVVTVRTPIARAVKVRFTPVALAALAKMLKLEKCCTCEPVDWEKY
jgi:hypothetical protein